MVLFREGSMFWMVARVLWLILRVLLCGCFNVARVL